MTNQCPSCIKWEAEFHRSEEKRIRDAVTYQVKLVSSKYKVKPGEENEKDLIARLLRMGEWKEDKKGKLVLHKCDIEVLSIGGYEITPEVAVRDLQPIAPHFFDGGEDTKTNDGSANPWAKNSFNLTRQGELFLQNPEYAKKLAAAAGITLKD